MHIINTLILSGRSHYYNMQKIILYVVIKPLYALIIPRLHNHHNSKKNP